MSTGNGTVATLGQATQGRPRGEQKKPIEQFKRRESAELVIAFAGPIGSGIKSVIDQADQRLQALNYKVHRIKLSGFIDAALRAGTINLGALPTLGKADRYIRLQDGGYALRERFAPDILAEWAVREIVGVRAEGMPAELDERPKDFVPVKVAYLIDQIKHPAEVELLRAVYRNLFYLVGVVSVASSREQRLLQEGVAMANVSELMERDRRQEHENGQQLDKALQLADFFIRNDRGNLDPIKEQIARFLSLLHGENGITPSRQEYGMYVAYAAGLKSACMSRQVGAAIANAEGEIIATGCNDVPKAGGGLYVTEDGQHDHRCVHREEQVCFNDREKAALREAMEGSLRDALASAVPDKASDPAVLDAVMAAVYSASRIKDLIEFSRAVHAEMEAIISLARGGGTGLTDAVLYSTTFPCHSCARHIVAAGIKRVYYIEPYEKSLAKSLHSDAIQFDTEESGAGAGTRREAGTEHVKFIHFEGIAPRQYLRFFTMNSRKDRTGKVIKIVPAQLPKAVNEYLDDYRDFEAKVVAHLSEILPDDGQEETA
ncbi:anti-phage dCTP deaminase [Cupriavidus sp. CuC1]|uniref:anti-phage dCTP deaminase n=1 Tax=Cupriavidus sp. CuC1 TaxID=3373131 RepID=UPI0037D86E4A